MGAVQFDNYNHPRGGNNCPRDCSGTNWNCHNKKSFFEFRRAIFRQIGVILAQFCVSKHDNSNLQYVWSIPFALSFPTSPLMHSNSSKRTARFVFFFATLFDQGKIPRHANTHNFPKIHAKHYLSSLECIKSCPYLIYLVSLNVLEPKCIFQCFAYRVILSLRVLYGQPTERKQRKQEMSALDAIST